MIETTCNAQGQTLTNVTVAHPDVSITNALLAGIITNYGWIANSTVQPNAELTGGVMTGYIINQGTLKDFEFRGATLTGGTLAGHIINDSKVDGVLSNVHLVANTYLNGGNLKSLLTGDPAAPALLENVVIQPGSHLSYVIIGENTNLSEEVILGEGVRFSNPTLIPDALELSPLLPELPPPSTECVENLTRAKRLDLSKDVLTPSAGILATINALPDLKNNHWLITQEARNSYLELTIDKLRFAVQPLSVTHTDQPAALQLLDQQTVQFITDTGLVIFSQPAVQSPCALQTSLKQWNLPQVTLQTNGNLYIPFVEGTWFSARPDWMSLEIDHDTGLFLMDSPYLPGVALAYTVFRDPQGKHRQQFFHPAPVRPDALYSATQETVIELYGLVSFTFNGQHYHGVLDYLVTPGSPPATGRLEIEPIVDRNDDGRGDWVLIYPQGERQVLFQND